MVHLRSIIWQTINPDRDTAEYYFRMCDTIAKASTDSSTIYEVLFLSSVFDRHNEEYEIAKEKILSVIDYSQRQKDTANIHRIHFHISSVYNELEEYERAIYHALRARDDTPRSSFRMHYNLTSRLTSIYKNIGLDDNVLREWMWYYENHDISLPKLEALTLGRISDEYLKQSKPDSALIYANLSLSTALENGSFDMEFRAYANQALAHFQNGDVEKAFDLGKMAYNHFGEDKKWSNPLAYITARKAYGAASQTKSLNSKATEIYKEGLQVSQRKNYKKDERFFLEKLLQGAIDANRRDEATTYSKELTLCNNAINKQYIDQGIHRIKMDYDIEKKDLEIQLLNSDRHVKELALERSQRNVVFAILGLALLGLISFLMYKSLVNKKKSQAILTEQNRVISTALSDKELLLKEIHHRVKNNLQVVSSLLSLQSEYIRDESALSAIKEGRNRVRSMSLIHQNLYKGENLKGINMKMYLENLIIGLFDSYNINDDRIQLQLNIQDLELDVDTVVPLGLITNELVSNALKHGFKTKGGGTVSVSLHEDGDQLELIVEDNGDGLDVSKVNDDISSFGYQMIYAFAEKLSANLVLSGDSGTTVKLTVSDYQKT